MSGPTITVSGPSGGPTINVTTPTDSVPPINVTGGRGRAGVDGSSAASASGEQATPAQVWIMDHDLGSYPAGIRFTSLDGETEYEPEEVQYTTLNRILALWPEAIAGKWFVS